MRLSDLNTSMLEDIRAVLRYDYVIRSDKKGRREFIIEPELSWHDDSIAITDRFGFSHKYESSNINISGNTLFIYSIDKVIQDFYVGYDKLSSGEQRNYDRFKVMREIQAATREPLDLSLLYTSIRVMIQSVISQMQSFDFTRDYYDLEINEETFTLNVDMKNLVYKIIDYDDEDTVIIRAYSFKSLIYEIIKYLSDRYRFKIDPRLREKLIGITDLAKIYDFDTIEVVEDF